MDFISMLFWLSRFAFEKLTSDCHLAKSAKHLLHFGLDLDGSVHILRY